MDRTITALTMKKYRSPAVFLLLGLTLFACVESPEVKRDKMVNSRNLGIEYYYQRKYPDALRELLKAEELYSQDGDLHNALGLVYMAIERNDLAVRHFKKAIQLKPKDSNAKNNLGVAYMNMKQWDNAIPYFEEVSKDLVYNTPHYPLINLGWVYYNKENYNLSEQYYLKALKLRPNYDDALYGLGRTYLAMGKIPEAINRIEAAIRISSNKPRYHYDLALAYVKSGEFKKASGAYRRVVELVPNTPLAFEASEKLKGIEKKR